MDCQPHSQCKTGTCVFFVSEHPHPVWVAKTFFFRKDAKIDSAANQILLGSQVASPYQQLIDKTKNLSFRRFVSEQFSSHKLLFFSTVLWIDCTYNSRQWICVVLYYPVRLREREQWSIRHSLSLIRSPNLNHRPKHNLNLNHNQQHNPNNLKFQKSLSWNIFIFVLSSEHCESIHNKDQLSSFDLAPLFFAKIQPRNMTSVSNNTDPIVEPRVMQKNRELCWKMRDLYHKCLDLNHEQKDKCTNEWENYNKNCLPSWVLNRICLFLFRSKIIYNFWM